MREAAGCFSIMLSLAGRKRFKLWPTSTAAVRSPRGGVIPQIKPAAKAMSYFIGSTLKSDRIGRCCRNSWLPTMGMVLANRNFDASSADLARNHSNGLRCTDTLLTNRESPQIQRVTAARDLRDVYGDFDCSPLCPVVFPNHPPSCASLRTPSSLPARQARSLEGGNKKSRPVTIRGGSFCWACQVGCQSPVFRDRDEPPA